MQRKDHMAHIKNCSILSQKDPRSDERMIDLVLNLHFHKGNEVDIEAKKRLRRNSEVFGDLHIM